MNPFKYLLVIAIIVVASSCAWNRNVSVDPVGPARQTRGSESRNGTLIVYSVWEGSIDDPEHMHHAPYRILSESGQLIRKVQNWNGNILDDPTPVALPPSTYRIEAHAQGYGTVTVPVLIEAHRATSVYLDDSTVTSVKGLAPGNAVSLPDGRIVGWRADLK